MCDDSKSESVVHLSSSYPDKEKRPPVGFRHRDRRDPGPFSCPCIIHEDVSRPLVLSSLSGVWNWDSGFTRTGVGEEERWGGGGNRSVIVDRGPPESTVCHRGWRMGIRGSCRRARGGVSDSPRPRTLRRRIVRFHRGTKKVPVSVRSGGGVCGRVPSESDEVV